MVSALAALLIGAGGVLALAAGLAFSPPASATPRVLETILPTREITPPPPKQTPTPEPDKARQSAPRDRPAPAGRKNIAAPIVAPPPPIPPLIEPPPVPTAPVAGTGSASRSGASDRG